MWQSAPDRAVDEELADAHSPCIHLRHHREGWTLTALELPEAWVLLHLLDILERRVAPGTTVVVVALGVGDLGGPAHFGVRQ